MNIRLLRIWSAAALAAVALATQAQAPQPGQSDVVALDYLRYEGRYYEIARLPTWRQRDCAADVVTTFVRRVEGDVSFVNQCIENDKAWVMQIGRLVTTDTDQRPGELRFRADLIGWNPWFQGTFRLIELAGDFSYAMIGDPGGSQLWILSRTRKMDDGLYQRLVARAAERGYDTAKLVRPIQTGL
jgi:apolipoprotein D and lipocalin family protein